MDDFEEYADLLVFYMNNPTILEKYKDNIIHYINNSYAVIHVPLSEFSIKTIGTFGYSPTPKLLGLTSEVSLDASGVDQVRNIPSLNLRGAGVLIGIVDTGIDYTNPVFLNSDGTTRITAIWDQNIASDVHPYNTPFGAEYRSDQINQAIGSDQPYELVPSRDENGHGTMLAGIAAGNEVPEEGFSGVATASGLVVVKLRQAKKYLRDFYFIPEDIVCYQENHIIWGVEYCLKVARELKQPIAICIGLGSSQGAHDGSTLLSRYLSGIADYPRVIIVTSAGNEGNLGRHFRGTIESDIGYRTVELNVAEGESGFSMELWGDSPGIYSIDIRTPNGEYVSRIAPSLRVNREITFTFERTVIYVDYLLTESETGDQLILMRFKNVSAGTWSFNVYGQGNLPLSFHIWLPMGDMISRGTSFVQPDIYTTILSPGNSAVPIAVTAYNPSNRNLYVNASRGYTRSFDIKPELAAPGVNYIAPDLNHGFVNYTGTSIAAAHTTGITAMILEWGVTRGNLPRMDTIEMKNYLIRGAIRTPVLTYPNRDWGYGILDVFNTFSTLKIDYGR